MKQLFLFPLLSMALVAFSQQADLADKKAVGHNRVPVIKATAIANTPADKTDRNAAGTARGKQQPISPTDTTGLSSQQKHIGK